MLERFIQLYEQGTRFVVFDVETVGPPNAPVIVEIGAVEAGKNHPGKQNHFHKILRYNPPSWKPYWREMKIHKIPAVEIENGDDRLDTLRKFCEFVQDAVLVCHTPFDIRAIQYNIKQHQELQQFHQAPIWSQYIDSLRIARKVCPHISSHALSSLADYFEIENPQAHRALADAATTKTILRKLLKYYYYQE